MQRVLISVLVILLLICGNCSASSITCRVFRVIDGDTLIATDHTGKGYIMHLYGLDAPELAQPSGEESKGMLSAMVLNKDVEVSVVGKDQTGFPHVLVSLDKISINAAMVKSGHAWVQPASCRTTECVLWSEYQVIAKSTSKGLWSFNDTVAPWVWGERRARATTIAQRLTEANDNFTYETSIGRKYRAPKSRIIISSGSRTKSQWVNLYIR